MVDLHGVVQDMEVMTARASNLQPLLSLRREKVTGRGGCNGVGGIRLGEVAVKMIRLEYQALAIVIEGALFIYEIASHSYLHTK